VIDLIKEHIANPINGSHSLKISLYHSDFCEWINEINIKAYHIGSKEMDFLKEHSKGITGEEGESFEFISIDDINNIIEVNMPDAGISGRYEISASTFVQDNHIHSNSDTYGTQFGIKYQTFYLMYVTDHNKYYFIKESGYVF